MISLQAIPIEYSSNIWVTPILVGCLLCIVISKVLFPERFFQFIVLPFEIRFFSIKKNEQRLSFIFNFMLFVFSALIFGILTLQITKYYRPDIPKREFVFFIQMVLAYGVIVLLKYFIEKIIANIFSIEAYIETYLFHKFSYRHYMAFILFPFCIISYYTGAFSGFALAIILGIVSFIQVVLMVKFYKNYSRLILSHLFYFILYLCALEIAPYLILYKIVTLKN